VGQQAVSNEHKRKLDAVAIAERMVNIMTDEESKVKWRKIMEQAAAALMVEPQAAPPAAVPAANAVVGVGAVGALAGGTPFVAL
jgi:hypothetical protein